MQSCAKPAQEKSQHHHQPAARICDHHGCYS